MPIIAKRQPLHRPSIQSPPTIAAIFIFDIIADNVHSYQHTIMLTHVIAPMLQTLFRTLFNLNKLLWNYEFTEIYFH